MKKIWGYLLCIAIVSACSLGVLFTGGATINNVKASTTPANPNNITIQYNDDYKIPEENKVNLIEHQKESHGGQTYDNKFVKFGKVENEQVTLYGGYASAAGTTGTFYIFLENGQQFDPQQESNEASWFYIHRADSITSPYNEDAVYIGDGFANSRSTVHYTFGDYGVYRVQIFTYAIVGGVTTHYVNTFIFVVQMEEPRIGQKFEGTNPSHYGPDGANVRYYKQSVKVDTTDKNDKSIEGTRIMLGFAVDNRDRDKAVNPEIVETIGYTIEEIKRETIRNKKKEIISNEEVSRKTIPNADFFLQLAVPLKDMKTYDDDGRITSDKFTFKLGNNKEVINGEYVITFTVKYNEYRNVTVEGQGTMVTGTAARAKIKATIIFEDQPKSFPVWGSLLICAAILAALGLGYYGCNYVIQYAQVNNIRKEQHAQMKRAETDRANIERLRDSMAADSSDK